MCMCGHKRFDLLYHLCYVVVFFFLSNIFIYFFHYVYIPLPFDSVVLEYFY